MDNAETKQKILNEFKRVNNNMQILLDKHNQLKVTVKNIKKENDDLKKSNEKLIKENLYLNDVYKALVKEVDTLKTDAINTKNSTSTIKKLMQDFQSSIARIHRKIHTD